MYTSTDTQSHAQHYSIQINMLKIKQDVIRDSHTFNIIHMKYSSPLKLNNIKTLLLLLFLLKYKHTHTSTSQTVWILKLSREMNPGQWSQWWSDQQTVTSAAKVMKDV